MKKVAFAILFGATTMLMADGAALFAKCAGCHGKDAKMPAMGKSAPIAGMPSADVVTSLEGYKAGTLNKNGLGGVMKGQAAALTPEQMKELGDYIAAMPK